VGGVLGCTVGFAVGLRDGMALGMSDGMAVGSRDGMALGDGVGPGLGPGVGVAVEAVVGINEQLMFWMSGSYGSKSVNSISDPSVVLLYASHRSAIFIYSGESSAISARSTYVLKNCHSYSLASVWVTY
jgi:hypothetical protein